MLDSDRHNHHTYVRALERFGKYNSSTKAIEILVNSDYDELIKEAKQRFPDNTSENLHNEINNINSDVHAAYCLRTIIEKNIDEQVTTQVKLKLSVGTESYYDYDGMLFLHTVLNVMNPYVMQI